MNAAQRRQDRRRFPCQVLIQATHWQRYFEHDNNVESAHEWCQQHFKQDHWRCTTNWTSAKFRFVNQQDATLFMLRWS